MPRSAAENTKVPALSCLAIVTVPLKGTQGSEGAFGNHGGGMREALTHAGLLVGCGAAANAIFF